mmetsp:Transcript_1390/g.3207  ORF Transcript_1390/g.3207 Transcript_1390/m.3207 type:complete len:355 (+) Transcript_1390:102-1166(+)
MASAGAKALQRASMLVSQPARKELAQGGKELVLGVPGRHIACRLPQPQPSPQPSSVRQLVHYPAPIAHRHSATSTKLRAIRSSFPPTVFHIPNLNPHSRIGRVERRTMSLRPGDDPYKILGVERGLTDKEYKVAYLKLAKRWHPDLNPGDAEATRKFQQLASAYNSIKDATARANWSQRQAFGQGQRSSGDPRGAWSGFGSSPSRSSSAEEVWDAAAKDAAAMAEAFGNYLQEQAQEVEKDINTFSDAAYRSDWPVAREIAMRRKGLILGVAVPLLVVLRWPAAAVAALRVASLGAGTALKVFGGVIAVMVRTNPQLLMAIWGMIAPIATSLWENGVRRARDRLRQKQEPGDRR